ncbi:MAG: glucose-6-phosphate isomerase, partial [Bacteroidaceae bacterium]|nr:glucose-6-phosphate isomerase [Bacteroidaceae bacterium]
MKNISLNIDKVTGFVTREQIAALRPQVERAQKALEEGTLPGNDFLGWLHLPTSISKEQLQELKAVAETLRSKCEVVVVAGIGGSYLGARAVIEALSNNFAALMPANGARVIFAGHNICEDYLCVLMAYLKGKKF